MSEAMEETQFAFDRHSLNELRSNGFDENGSRFTCCCNHMHSTTGMRVICGMLWITVLFELWQMFMNIHANLAHIHPSNGNLESSIIQFVVGVCLASTVLLALVKKRSVYLIPYLVIQMVGLASSCVFFIAFVYIGLFGDQETAVTFLRSYGKALTREETTHQNYLKYVAWMMVGSFAIIIALQMWLMSIVVACFRYYRDRNNFIQQNGYTYFTLKRATRSTSPASTLRVSVSVDQLVSPRKTTAYRAHSIHDV